MYVPNSEYTHFLSFSGAAAFKTVVFSDSCWLWATYTRVALIHTIWHTGKFILQGRQMSIQKLVNFDTTRWFGDYFDRD